MSRDRQFKRENDFREITDRDLYYELEFNVKSGFEVEEDRLNSLILYLLITSIALEILFSISQLITIVLILIYGLTQQYFPDYFSRGRKTVALVILLTGNIIDHAIAGIYIFPGSIITDEVSFLGWVFEIIWILIYGIEFMLVFSPTQPSFIAGRTVSPATESSKYSYSRLKKRVENSNYNIVDFENDVDTRLVQSTFQQLVRYLIITFGVIVVLYIIIWQIISILSGGNNVEEAYFVSGISLIIYISLMIYSSNFFNDENSEKKTVSQRSS